MAGKPIDPLPRFWAKVRKLNNSDGCWEWTGALQPNGYGRFGVNASRGVLVHRYSYELAHGPQAIKGLCVCHRCDNRRCVRPDHLFTGDHFDNMRDASRKGRLSSNTGRAGVSNMHAKLNPVAVRVIRHVAALEFDRERIAKVYGITTALVGNIVRGEIWKEGSRSMG